MATIRKRGDKWQVQIRRRGSRAFSRSFLLKKDANAWARDMEVKADRYGLPSDPKALERITLGELVARYRDTISCRKRGFEIERIVLNAFLRHPICNKKLSEVSGADFAAYRDERLTQIKPASLKRQLDPIQHLFEVARAEWGISVTENPLIRLNLKRCDKRRERRLRDGELERLIQAAKASRSPLLLPIILFALETGMRRGEILAIRVEHINLSRRTLLIPETKNGHPRTIPLTRAAVAILVAQHESGEQVFPMTANALRLAWERLRRRAGAPDLHFHDLRHEAISRFFELGLTIPEVASISGHRDVRMLFRYAHARPTTVLAKLDAGKVDDPIAHQNCTK